MSLFTSKKLEAAFKKAASDVDSRPILQCLHFDKDGSAVTTDSHVMLRINDFHNLSEPLNLNLKTFTAEDGDYPETARLVPKDYDFQLSVKADDLAEALPVITGMSKSKDKSTLATLAWDVDEHELRITSGLLTLNIPAVITYGLTPKGKKLYELATVNPKYLAQAIEFYTQVTVTPRVSLGFNGALRPIALTYETATYLITPVRNF